jgi:hypothetical protein
LDSRLEDPRPLECCLLNARPPPRFFSRMPQHPPPAPSPTVPAASNREYWTSSTAPAANLPDNFWKHFGIPTPFQPLLAKDADGDNPVQNHLTNAFPCTPFTPLKRQKDGPKK